MAMQTIDKQETAEISVGCAAIFPVYLTTPVGDDNSDDDDDNRSNDGKVEYSHRKGSRYSTGKIGGLINKT